MNEQWNPLLSINHGEVRAQALVNWLQSVSPYPITGLTPMTGDASFRRYFRVLTTQGSYVIMDAPPQKEDVVRFMAIAKAIIARDLNAPHIYAHNIADGFLLLSDFGDLTYLRAFETHEPSLLYQNALRALAVLQHDNTYQGLTLPHFTHDLMHTEWAWHKEWFLNTLLNLHDDTSLLDVTYDLLIENALLQPQVFMYRDFHSGNLMLLPNGEVGLLDFQDAFIGPITYDLASLLRDCYIDWPQTKVMEWALFYYSLLSGKGALQGVSQQQFLKWFDWMGVQRHLKALMTFARKAVRDHEPNYLQFVPRTLNYIIAVSHRYDELSAIASFYEDVVLPRFKETPS